MEFFSKFLPPPSVQLTKDDVLEQLELAGSPPLPKKRGRKRKLVHAPSEEESKRKQVDNLFLSFVVFVLVYI